MKFAIMTTVALAALANAVPAAASSSCYGCNLVQEGTANARLIGHTAYYGTTPYTVAGVDADRQIVYVKTTSGSVVWGDAKEFYSSQARGERNAGWTAAAAGGALIIVCMLGGCRSDRQSTGDPSVSAPSSRGSSTNCYPVPEGDGNYRGRQFCR